MSRHKVQEIQRVEARYHPAVHAWRQVRPDPFEPAEVEILKAKSSCSVYRLLGPPSGSSSIVAKKCPARTAIVERVFYERLLPLLPYPSVRCRGFLSRADGDACWLFLDDAGTGEYSPAQPDHRVLAARWVAALHRTRVSAGYQVLLPSRGTEHYLQLARASRFSLQSHFHNSALSAEETSLLRNLSAHYELLERNWSEVRWFCDGRPKALVHGDFVIKNLRVHPDPTGPALLVFDWEMAGWGVCATDLAQFVGRCASPDLDVYHSLAGEDLGLSSIEEVHRFAEYGNLLRLIDKCYWETEGMLPDYPYRCLLKPLRTLAKYEPQLAAVLEALGWSRS